MEFLQGEAPGIWRRRAMWDRRKGGGGGPSGRPHTQSLRDKNACFSFVFVVGWVVGDKPGGEEMKVALLLISHL